MSRLDASELEVDGQRCCYLVVSLGAPSKPPGLTPSEFEVAWRSARGESNVEIARARGTSRRTVDHQLASVYRKLAITSRSELAEAMLAINR